MNVFVYYMYPVCDWLFITKMTVPMTLTVSDLYLMCDELNIIYVYEAVGVKTPVITWWLPSLSYFLYWQA